MGEDTSRATLAENRNIELAKERIEMHRAEMQETVAAMREQLRPERLQHQAVEVVHEATRAVLKSLSEQLASLRDSLERRVGELAETARTSPMPVQAAAVGAGLGALWLLRRYPAVGTFCLGLGLGLRFRSNTSGHIEHTIR